MENLAKETCDEYKYFYSIDTESRKQNVSDYIEECLTHLEEFCDALESLCQNSTIPPDFSQSLCAQNSFMDKLCNQIDALDQYTFVTNKLLDELDVKMKELESCKLGDKGSRMKQLIGSISRLQLVRLPGLNLISGKNSRDEQEYSKDTLEKISENLRQVSEIKTSFSEVTTSLKRRVNRELEEPAAIINEQNFDTNQVQHLSDETNMDGSWQELL